MESTFSDTESESEICHSPNWISNASQASISFNYGEFSYPNSETQHIPELEVITAIENLEDTCVSLSEVRIGSVRRHNVISYTFCALICRRN
jgi:hypothetical protein